ncbi:hypothetical protein AB0O52_21375 [Arthrobacter sp. NPDC080073]|uniref:hypothetical protein n=1 Tax=Arthrobacter sp. NPDC080073 TaxID=3155919 RepID=UPI00342365E2
METAIANIMRGKSSTEEMSDELGRGKWETTGGTAMRKGPTKLRTRLVLESMPEADSQITGKMANVMSPGIALKAPFRVNQRAKKSKIGIARPALGANRSHGTSRQPRNRTPWSRTPVTNNQFWINPGQRVGAAMAKPAMMRVSGNSQTASRARGVSFLKKRAAARKNGCSLKVETLRWRFANQLLLHAIPEGSARSPLFPQGTTIRRLERSNWKFGAALNPHIRCQMALMLVS